MLLSTVVIKERYCTQTEKKKLIQISSLPNSTNGRKDTFDIESKTSSDIFISLPRNDIPPVK
jgi:hypothetical protein